MYPFLSQKNNKIGKKAGDDAKDCFLFLIAYWQPMLATLISTVLSASIAGCCCCWCFTSLLTAKVMMRHIDNEYMIKITETMICSWGGVLGVSPPSFLYCIYMQTTTGFNSKIFNEHTCAHIHINFQRTDLLNAKCINPMKINFKLSRERPFAHRRLILQPMKFDRKLWTRGVT